MSPNAPLCPPMSPNFRLWKALLLLGDARRAALEEEQLRSL